MKTKTLLLMSLLAGLSLSAQASWRATSDYNPCGHGMHGGGSDVYDSKERCEAECADLHSHYQCAICTCTEEGGSTSSGSGSSTSGLEDSTSQALAAGLVNGDSQTFGAGLAGLGALALLNSGSSQPSAADLERQRQAEWQRQEDQRAAEAAEAARKKKFQDEKKEAFDDLKGHDADLQKAMDDDFFGLKGVNDLKDSPKNLKPVPKIHLVNKGNPLHPAPRTGDSVGVLRRYDNWEEATDCDGLSAMDYSSGRIVCCPDGYPYYCGGLCYSEAALNGLRIPCNSKLTTSRH